MAMGISSHQHGGGIETDIMVITRERYGLETNDITAALATYIVGEAERMFPAQPMGRSRLQKLFYILSREGHVHCSFGLFMSGPYSDSVESTLNRAVALGMMTVVKENGRSSISARGGISYEVPFRLKQRADQCIHAFGFYDEEELAILTTALFLEGILTYGPDELVKVMLEINPRFDVRRVCSLLDRSDIVFRSW
jgi:hypothetical protein